MSFHCPIQGPLVPGEVARQASLCQFGPRDDLTWGTPKETHHKGQPLFYLLLEVDDLQVGQADGCPTDEPYLSGQEVPETAVASRMKTPRCLVCSPALISPEPVRQITWTHTARPWRHCFLYIIHFLPHALRSLASTPA